MEEQSRSCADCTLLYIQERLKIICNVRYSARVTNCIVTRTGLLRHAAERFFTLIGQIRGCDVTLASALAVVQ